jgi:Fungal specific transcription factor domain
MLVRWQSSPVSSWVDEKQDLLVSRKRPLSTAERVNQSGDDLSQYGPSQSVWAPLLPATDPELRRPGSSAAQLFNQQEAHSNSDATLVRRGPSEGIPMEVDLMFDRGMTDAPNTWVNDQTSFPHSKPASEGTRDVIRRERLSPASRQAPIPHAHEPPALQLRIACTACPELFADGQDTRFYPSPLESPSYERKTEFPNQDIVNSLFDTYFSCLHPGLPLLDKQRLLVWSMDHHEGPHTSSFSSQTETVPDELVFAILASAIPHSRYRDSTEPTITFKSFVSKAELLVRDSASRPSLGTIQALVLLSLAHLGRGEPLKASIQFCTCSRLVL